MDKDNMLKLDNSPFLKGALAYVASHPGCTKSDIVGKCPNATRSYRYARLNMLVKCGYVENRSNVPNRYSLFVKVTDENIG